MANWTNWLLERDRRGFRWVNTRLRVPALHLLLTLVTHLGGAVFTIVLTLGLALLAPEPWRGIGLKSLTALAASHVPVAVLKKRYPRLRPHQALPEVVTGRRPLIDPSFPSGHSTAVFAIAVTFSLHLPGYAPLFLLAAAAVALSRIYLGLHYPSDTLAGASLGTLAALAVSLLWPA
ncbi:phosphatase PAP2 family protein [Paenibacillus sp. J31TS4]|uniref:phosphatase PAP2 family protein n=1 Tax=Paenibacillus sp. J31TS4 TaxID=2807195 RepID=UPI001B1415B0|nr:phosphatase PAP2 family protein [Paenibacillus sp. J31TS4]GIP38890.1 phosphatase PAP2 family protein [Paenibacillus sp. J31TS4]